MATNNFCSNWPYGKIFIPASWYGFENVPDCGIMRDGYLNKVMLKLFNNMIYTYRCFTGSFHKIKLFIFMQAVSNAVGAIYKLNEEK